MYLPPAQEAVALLVNSDRTPRLALLLSVVAWGLLASGCSIIPGQDTYSMRTESSLALPTRQGDEVVPAYVTVKPINAELIIELKKAEVAHAPPKIPPAPYIDYRLGPGDILNIIVWEHPELTIPAGEFRSAEASGTLVSEEGTIFYPYVGVIKVEGLTLSELRTVLIRKLGRAIENVQLDVRIAAYRSQRVYVVGEVNEPGLQTIDDIPMTIVEAVNRADGFTREADYSRITLTRDGQAYRVNLQALYEDAATAQNVLLEPGDIVNVPDRRYNKVFVLGEVASPGSQIMDKSRKSLAEAIGDAADFDKLKANPHWIFVLRGSNDRPEIFHLDAKSPDALILADQFPLQARDIVFVDAAEIARWNRLISNLLPSATLIKTVSDIDSLPLDSL